MKSKNAITIVLIGILFFVTLTAGCNTKAGVENQEPPDVKNQLPNSVSTAFGSYQEVPVNVTGTLKSYEVEAGLGNVINKEMFQLSAEAERLLAENGFVVVPSQYREFFMLYEMNRYEPVPSFITTDSILHNYHLFFSHLLRIIEKEKLALELKELTAAMLSESEKQYTALKGTDWENAAKRNVGFFAVASKLLDPTAVIPEDVNKDVAEELQLIEGRALIQASPIMNIGQVLESPEALLEDYTQYIPRGHYGSDEALQAYFKAMMWYGRMTFRLKNEDETKSAVLMTLAMKEGDNEKLWDKIYEPTNFFVGKADDLSYDQYRLAFDKVYGVESGLEDVVSNSSKWKSFIDEASAFASPIINSIPIFEEAIQPDRELETKGFRFMGQRFTLDAAIFQRLVYRDVKENRQGERRMLPKAMDIPAALGSKEAYNILEHEGETEYAGYADNMSKLQQYISSLDKKSWTQNLYWSWLYTLMPLLHEKEVGYPSFMTKQAWARKDLNTFLSSWTELKHDTILYSKQVYAEMGGGMDGVDDRGYVEPNPHLYARLAALVKMTQEGLASRNLLEDRDLESLNRLEQLALYLKDISEKELSDIPLTEEEYDLIRSYGGQLEHFWLEALRDVGVDHRSAMAENPAALVADVATDPNGQVLEEATGHIFEIYAVVPVDGSLRIARGGVYSHYEFIWPISNRLTDKKWREMLDMGEPPPLADWVQTYIAQ